MEPREAATVMLVRDAPDGGLEVFLLRRNLRSVFVAGAYVFPGGAVDAGDRSPAMLALVPDLGSQDADARLATPGALGYWIAAIRESFEEGGVLLARDATSGAPVDPAVSRRLAPVRPALASGETSFADLLVAEGLVPDVQALRPFGRWITPAPSPRRYDTWFFVAPAPPDHAYAHDTEETVESEWMRPADALARAGRREIELIFPTFRSLQALARFPDTTALFAAVDRTWEEPDGALRVMRSFQGWQVRLPGDEDDSDHDALAHTATHRHAGAG